MFTAGAVLICGAAFASALEVGTVLGANSLNVSESPAPLLAVDRNLAANEIHPYRISLGLTSTSSGLFVLGLESSNSWVAADSWASIQARHVPSRSGLDDDSQEVDATIAGILVWHLELLSSPTSTDIFRLHSVVLPKIKPPP